MKNLFQITLVLLMLGTGATYAYDTGCGNDGQPPGDPCSNVGDPINAGMANVNREVTDLETFGTAPIQFTRIYNSRTTNFNDPYCDFGSKQTWQHNWNYEVRQLGSKTFGQFDIKVRYPDGREYDFVAPDATSNQRIPPAGCGDRLYKWSGSTVGYTLVTPEGREYDFLRYSSPKFHLTKTRDGQSLEWTFSYGSDEKLSRVANQFGRWIGIERSVVSGVSCISRVFSSDGRQITYGYSPWSATSTVVLTGVTYPGTEQAAYTWVTADPSSSTARPLLESASDPLFHRGGALVKYVYNYDAIYDYGAGPYLVTGTVKEEHNGATGAMIVSLPLGGGTYPQVLEGNGVEITRKFDKGMINELADGEGRKTVYTRSNDGYGFIESIMDPSGGTTSFTRDYAGHILTQTDALQHTRSFTYNAAGFVLSRTDERNFTTTTTRDSNNRPTRIDYPDGAYETWTYNIYGQVLTHRGCNDGTETMAYYDGVAVGGKRGDLQTYTDTLNNVTSYTYTDAGLRATVKDARANSTAYTYDWRGHVLNVTYPDGSVVRSEYDSFGNRFRGTDEMGKVWETTYNEYQHVATFKDPLNRITSYEYGREPGCASCGFADTLTRITLPSGKKVEYAYDRSWKRTSQVVGAGTPDAATTSYAYNSAGDMSAMTDPRGKATNYTYNLLHQRLTTTDPLGNSKQWTYDSKGNVQTETRADNGVFRYEYDSMDRRTKTTGLLNQVTQMAYDAAGNMITLSDARNNAYRSTYDLRNRKTRLSYPDASHEDWGYDAVGNAITYTNRAGQTKTINYDVRNRETDAAWDDGITPEVITSYDAVGRVLTLNNANSALSYAYNDAGQLSSEMQNQVGGPGAKTVAYTYDADGKRTQLTNPDGTVVAYSYTTRNQLSSVTLSGPPPLVTYIYDLAGNRLSKSLENGTTATYTYDDANRLTSLVNQTSSTTLNSFSYAYDKVNNRTSVTNAGGLGDSYAYDPTDQLTGVQYGAANPASAPTNPQSTQTYTYDAVGNRTTVNQSGTTTSYSTNNLNQYVQAGATTIGYDANGNLASGLGGLTYSYDAQNRLVSVQAPSKRQQNGFTMQFFYDAQNRCVRRDYTPPSGGIAQYPTSTTFFYDAWNLVAEFNNVGTQTAKYVHGAAVDELLARIDTNGTVYYHHDALGSVAGLTNSSGQMVEQYSYDVFGQPSFRDAIGTQLSDSAYGNRFLFTGREWLRNLGGYEHRNRVYSPKTGRFLQTDPIRFKGGDLNLYRYVYNNPCVLTDRYGLDACPDGQTKDPICVAQAQKKRDKALEDAKQKENEDDGATFISCGVFLFAGPEAYALCLASGAIYNSLQRGKSEDQARDQYTADVDACSCNCNK